MTTEPKERGEATAEPTKEVKLTREQLRHKERVESEASEVYNQLTGFFMDFFLETHDPTSEQMQVKQRELSAKWRIYCKRKELLPIAYKMIDEYCDRLITEYQDEKLEKNTPLVINPKVEVNEVLPVEAITFKEMVGLRPQGISIYRSKVVKD